MGDIRETKEEAAAVLLNAPVELLLLLPPAAMQPPVARHSCDPTPRDGEVAAAAVHRLGADTAAPDEASGEGAQCAVGSRRSLWIALQPSVGEYCERS
mmetsp:Transcript_81049/g.160617  ORF Transcript_81049/g.160617 Transcript_81049/m.160617 type:complete len:98 (-) Transcript_81049:223-516(-)